MGSTEDRQKRYSRSFCLISSVWWRKRSRTVQGGRKDAIVSVPMLSKASFSRKSRPDCEKASWNSPDCERVSWDSLGRGADGPYDRIQPAVADPRKDGGGDGIGVGPFF